MTDATTPAGSPGGARPLVIAHRGASALAPENTIAAFERALADGADAIELDVHLSRDGHPVVVHDFTLERTAGAASPVSELTVRELKRLDVGAWRGPAWRGQRIQTLAEVLERFRGRTRFWVELRAGSSVYPDIEAKAVGALQLSGTVDDAVLLSWDPGVLVAARALDHALPLGLLVAQAPVAPPAGVPATAVCPAVEVADAEGIGRVRAAGLGCYVWTVNDADTMERLVGWGASGIITDRPDLARTRLGR